MFLRQCQRQRKCFLSERELKKALRDTLTRAAWSGPVIFDDFWLVRSAHAHASNPGLFFRPPGFSPCMGREERRVQGLDYCYRGQRYLSWARTHDGDGGVAQHGGHTPNNRLMEACCPGLPCTFLIYDIRLWSIDTFQIKLSADQHHVTISRAQVYSSSTSRVLLKLTADQVLVFDLIAGSFQVNLLKTEPGCLEAC